MVTKVCLHVFSKLWRDPPWLHAHWILFFVFFLICFVGKSTYTNACVEYITRDVFVNSPWRWHLSACFQRNLLAWLRASCVLVAC